MATGPTLTSKAMRYEYIPIAPYTSPERVVPVKYAAVRMTDELTTVLVHRMVPVTTRKTMEATLERDTRLSGTWIKRG